MAAGGTTGSGSTRVGYWLRHAAVVLAALAVVGGLVAASGIVPIKASAGHWPITRWFLSFAMARSVSTYSLPVSTPALDDPALVLKGAGHYDFGCRPCHGSPGQRPPTIALAMTPSPPYLPPAVAGWDPEELFYIVKHGVKFTAMPAWPSLRRDDEVWAMVAFLRTLPRLDATGYRRLVSGDETVGAEVARVPGLPRPRHAPGAVRTSCGPCHGVDGHGRGLGAFPRLAGQRPAYLLGSLEAYARGERQSGIMGPIAAGLGADEMRELSGYYASLPATVAHTVSRPDRAAGDLGETIAQRGLPRRRVPACVACHGPGAGPRNPMYPQLAGQYAEYLALQLRLFKDDRRGGTPYAHIMRMVAARLTPEQVAAVAAYYASLPPATEPSALESRAAQ
jgi:cytochrome c553